MATIQGIYIALFGRPADPSGLAYWGVVTNDGIDLSNLVGKLTAEKEYTDRFTGKSNTEIVTSIYQALFGRVPDVEGLKFFVDGLDNGTLKIETIAINILDGAQGSDRTLVEGKIAAANFFTSHLDLPAEIAAYNGNTAAQVGRDYITSITKDNPGTGENADAAILKLFSQGGQTPSEGGSTSGDGGGGGGESTNHAPVASPFKFDNIAEDSLGFTITKEALLTHASDADGDTLSITDFHIVSGDGTLTANPDGSWIYVPKADYNGDVTFSYTVSDSTASHTSTASVTVTPVNDAAVITGDITGTVVEAGGVDNATAGTPTVTGDLNNTDVDNTSDVWQVVDTATASDHNYGSYTIDASGNWSFTLDNDNAAVQALKLGEHLTETFTVSTEDGTAQQVTITIDGANDAAVITGDITGTVVEAGGVDNATAGTPTVTGDLNNTDVDNTSDVWQVVDTATASDHNYGSYTIDASGNWSFTLDNDNAAVQALKLGEHLTETFTVSTEDGTAQQVTITIDGANDAAVITGDITGTVVEAGGVDNATAGTPTVTGDLNNTDVDNTSDVWQVVDTATASDHNYGSYTIDASGNWSFTLDNGNAAVQALKLGEHLTETFTVSTEDGTAQQVTITIDGANDAPKFDHETYTFSINENATGPVSGPTAISASDADAGDTLTYALANDFGGLFKIDSNGAISLNSPVDYEALATKKYDLTVIATDGGNATDQAAVTVNINDVAEAHTVVKSIAQTSDGQAFTFQFNDIPTEASNVKITITARGDYDNYSSGPGATKEYATISFDGTSQTAGTSSGVNSGRYGYSSQVGHDSTLTHGSNDVSWTKAFDVNSSYYADNEIKVIVDASNDVDVIGYNSKVTVTLEYFA